MFYFDEINGKKILKLNLITKADAFFTTREICICDKKTNNKVIVQGIKDKVDQISRYLDFFF